VYAVGDQLNHVRVIEPQVNQAKLNTHRPSVLSTLMVEIFPLPVRSSTAANPKLWLNCVKGAHGVESGTLVAARSRAVPMP